MDEKFWLVTGTSVDEVERTTGLRAYETHLGTLVERHQPLDLAMAMDKIDRALHPNRCTCGEWSVLHRANCPAAYLAT